MFQESNAIYLVSAYVVFLGGLLAYLASLKIRQRNLDRDAATLNQIAAEMDAERAAKDRESRNQSETIDSPAPQPAEA